MTASTTSTFAPPSPATPDHRDGYFTHHGLWAPGVRMFRRMQFRSKAAIISFFLLAPLLGLLGWQVSDQAAQALQARKDAIRAHVEIAYSVVERAHSLQVAGKLTQAQAQAMAKETLSAARYDGNEYFFVTDMTPTMLAHPIKHELIDTDVSHTADPTGFRPFQAMADLVRQQGKGFVRYQWPKPGFEEPVDKITYVRGFAPWGWVIGTGLYVGDLRDAMVHGVVLDASIAASALFVAAYLFASFYLVMNGGLKETRRHLLAMTSGDLTTTPAPWGTDEAADLMNDLRAMQLSLRKMVATVRGSSQDLLDSSTSIATGAKDLSARTEQTAANLEQSAAAMEQISATVRITSGNTIEAAAVAEQNATVAASGGQAMRDVVGTMEAIRASSSKIGEIIGTIDGIAFQTNILALNAAVEAARAGDHGRGFSVVAAEVRMLAQRSAEAAKEIKALIGTSVDQIGTGSAVVHRAGETIGQIVSSSDRVRQLLSEVSSGAREQSTGVAQVGTALTELDRMTQQNAGLVEQTVNASSTLMNRATALAENVSRFKLPSDAR